MSSPRYDWWGYVKGMIRRYPTLCEEYADIKSQSITVSYEASGGHSSNVGRAVESIAIKELPATKEREYWAVTKAIELTRKMPNGHSRLRMIDLVYWKKSHTLMGAAHASYLSEISARRYHAEFIRLVASYYGLMDT